MTIFPVKWRANEQLGGGWAPTSYEVSHFGEKQCKGFPLIVHSLSWYHNDPCLKVPKVSWVANTSLSGTPNAQISTKICVDNGFGVSNIFSVL